MTAQLLTKLPIRFLSRVFHCSGCSPGIQELISVTPELSVVSPPITISRFPHARNPIPHPPIDDVLSGRLPMVTHLLLSFSYLLTMRWLQSAEYNTLFITASKGGAPILGSPPRGGIMSGISRHVFLSKSYSS
ncbi:hypothetical protein V8G54_017635, partial [Vigna mungo]